MNAPVTNLPSTELAPSRRDATMVFDTIPVLDSARFEHMQRIASIMAKSSLIPETLYTTGRGNDKKFLPYEQVFANCFLIVNQAVRWGFDPFAVVQCASVVKGKLCYEGKLVAAVLDAKLGIELDYVWNDKKGDDFGIVVSGTLPSGKVKTADGTVGRWKTTGDNSPWPKQPKLQLAYRGSREWARLNKPAIMLGVYTEDEMSEMSDGARERREAERARPTPPRPPQATKVAETPQIEPQTQTPMVVETARETVAAEIARPTPPRPPAPSKPAAPPAAAEIDPVALYARFASAAKAAETIEQLTEAWERIVEPAKESGDLFPGDEGDLLSVFRQREGELS